MSASARWKIKVPRVEQTGFFTFQDEHKNNWRTMQKCSFKIDLNYILSKILTSIQKICPLFCKRSIQSYFKYVNLTIKTCHLLSVTNFIALNSIKLILKTRFDMRKYKKLAPKIREKLKWKFIFWIDFKCLFVGSSL